MLQEIRRTLLTNLSVFYIILLILLMGAAQSCNEDETRSEAAEKKTAVLLVNHGSRSETWRKTLLALEDSVSEAALSSGTVQGIKTAFMEYNEPSIATRLREFDKEGYTDVIIVPVFLTVSPHSFDDIPTIVGLKEDPQSLEMLKLEKIERYTPRARVTITPLPDFSKILRENVLNRFRRISSTPADEGLVMIAYGDETYTREWSGLLAETGKYVCS